MREAGRVLLKVDARNADAPRFTLLVFDLQPAVARERQIELRDLVALHKIGIGVVLAVELRVLGNLTIQGERRHDGQCNSLPIDDG